jgi:hypothetical protein
MFDLLKLNAEMTRARPIGQKIMSMVVCYCKLRAHDTKYCTGFRAHIDSLSVEYSVIR